MGFPAKSLPPEQDRLPLLGLDGEAYGRGEKESDVLRPLVKWAGGKRQILAQLFHYMPRFSGRYFEPFVGGGALLVELYRRGLIHSALISDINLHLFNLYSVVKVTPCALISELHGLGLGNTPGDYYAARDAFNKHRDYSPPHPRMAALMLYLNRHCFNGLWRENTTGCMNAPFGRYRRPAMPSDDHVWAFHRMLRHVEVLRCDFEEAVETCRPGDFAYFDPPYMPVSATASFVDYTAAGFSLADQERLGRVARSLANRGVFVMLSNADLPEIRGIYRGFYIHPVSALRSINSRGDRRKGVRELIITNYEV